MDSFAAVRARARQVRASLEERKGPLSGPEAVREAFREKEIDLYMRQPLDPVLNGGDAVLDCGMAAVYIRKDRSEEEIATLAAHELGHLEVHDTAHACTSFGIDLSVPEEASPVGVERVEQYGARERRELQANVFGREFLLPCHIAIRLFRHNGCHASDIATRVQLPLNVVRQQLCDALLLPDSETLEDDKRVEARSLNQTQREVVLHNGSPLLVDAGPGTGKTQALVARIVHLIENGADPACILALTFSNKAAHEITQRVADLFPQAAPQIWTGTFHAFGLELLRRYYHLFDFDPEIRVIDRSDAIELLEERLPTLGLVHYQNLYEPALELREMLTAISRAKDELVDADIYLSLGHAQLANATNDEERISAQKVLEVAQVYKIYEQTLYVRKEVDFGDLIMKLTLLLEAQPALRDAVRVRHRHILVDEYQDVNRASARLLKAIVGDGERLWVVGDARQSIYRFRGASSANIVLFSQDFPGANYKSLDTNYRSTKEIIEAYTAFSRGMSASRYATPLALHAERGSSALPPGISVAGTPEEEVSLIAGRITELLNQGVAFRDQAVLCRTNDRVNDIAEGLEARGIPVLYLGSLFERGEVRDLLSLLSFIVDPKGNGLARIAAFSAYRIPLDDVSLFLKTAEEQDITALDLLQSLPSLTGLSESGKNGLTKLAADLSGAKPGSMPWELLANYLFEQSTYLQSIRSNASQTCVRSCCKIKILQAKGVSCGRP